MSIRIAIPEPASPLYIENALAYNQRALPQYLSSLHSAGATPILVPLHETPQRIAKILSTTVGILLPGSGADIDPQKYGQPRNPLSAEPDLARSVIDELMFHDAFQYRKPILTICYGTQALNVRCGGSMIQDIPSQVGSAVDHAPDRSVLDAHPVEIAPNTLLASLVPASDQQPLQVNSSHHQAILTVGERLVVGARCPVDKVVEAVELEISSSDPHWVVGVQWHPERTYLHSAFSRAIFAAFVHAAAAWASRRVEDSVVHA